MATFPGENILSLREFKKMYPEQTYKYHTYPTSVLLSELRTILLYVYTICPGSSNPFYMVTHYINWGNYFLDTQ